MLVPCRKHIWFTLSLFFQSPAITDTHNTSTYNDIHSNHTLQPPTPPHQTMRGALLSTAVVALSLVLVRGGASGDGNGARLRASKSAGGDAALRQLHEEMITEQHQHEAKFGRRVSGEEIKALVAHRRQAHPGKPDKESMGLPLASPFESQQHRRKRARVCL